MLINELIDNKYRWNIVKVSFDRRNETLEECAMRECLEETGLEVQLDAISSILTFKKNDKYKVQFNFVATPLTKVLESQAERNLNIENEHIKEIRWFNKQEVLQMKKGEFVADYTQETIINTFENVTYNLAIIKEV